MKKFVFRYLKNTHNEKRDDMNTSIDGEFCEYDNFSLFSSDNIFTLIGIFINRAAALILLLVILFGILLTTYSLINDEFTFNFIRMVEVNIGLAALISFLTMIYSIVTAK